MIHDLKKGVGSVGDGGSVLVNQELKLFDNWKKSWVVSWGSGGCEPRIEVIVKLKKSG